MISHLLRTVLKQLFGLFFLKEILDFLYYCIVLIELSQETIREVHLSTIDDAHANLLAIEVNLDEFHLYLCIKIFKYNSYNL